VSLDASTSSSQDDKVIIVGAVVGSVALLILIIAVIILYSRRNTKVREHSMIPQPQGQPPQRAATRIYDQPNPYRGSVGQVSDPVYDRAITSPTYLEFGSPLNDSYLEVSNVRGNNHGGNGLYSMSDDALFSPSKVSQQSTRM